MRILTHRGYSAGHPWYYFLGGTVPPIKTISQKQEPQKSTAIKAMRQMIEEELCADISIYRKCARELSANQLNSYIGTELAVCADIHVSMSLKFNHIYNGFANLKTLEALPEQISLFDLL